MLLFLKLYIDMENSIIIYQAQNGETQRVETMYYNIEAILSVGYRGKFKNAIQFGIWANKI